MNYEDIIKRSIEKLNRDIEQRNALYLNLIHKNIDILAHNSHLWFGDTVPKEFVEVLNSLVNFSVLFAEQSRRSIEFLAEKNYELFELAPFFEELRYDFTQLVSFKSVKINGNRVARLITSKEIFRDSIYHIFFAISQFGNNESFCEVDFTSDHSSTVITLNFSDLDEEEVPDIQTLLRIFFAHIHKNHRENDEFDLRIGLSIAVENLKNIGGTVHIVDSVNRDSITVTVTFPSPEFLDTINDVRKYDLMRMNKKKSGTIIFSLTDRVGELLLSESLKDAGYTIVCEKIEKVLLSDVFKNALAVIIDFATISQLVDFEGRYLPKLEEKTVIVIHKKHEELKKYPGIHYLEIPFAIERVLEFI